MIWIKILHITDQHENLKKIVGSVFEEMESFKSFEYKSVLPAGRFESKPCSDFSTNKHRNKNKYMLNQTLKMFLMDSVEFIYFLA